MADKKLSPEFINAADVVVNYYGQTEVNDQIDALIRYITQNVDASYNSGILYAVPILVDLRRLAMSIPLSLTSEMSQL